MCLLTSNCQVLQKCICLKKIVTFNDEAGADKNFYPTIHTILQEIYCSAPQPCELNSRKIVIVRGLDPIILENSDKMIAHEI